MPVQVSWYNDHQTIVLYKIGGQWTLQEVIEAKLAFEADVNSLPDYFIVDMREAGMIPDGTLANREKIFEHFDTPDTLTVIIGGNRLMQWMVNMMQRMGLVSQFVFVESLEAAGVYIQTHRQQRAG